MLNIYYFINISNPKTGIQKHTLKYQSYKTNYTNKYQLYKNANWKIR